MKDKYGDGLIIDDQSPRAAQLKEQLGIPTAYSAAGNKRVPESLSTEESDPWHVFLSEDGTEVHCKIEDGYLTELYLEDEEGNTIDLEPEHFEKCVLEQNLGFVPKIR